jgi:hypothetical protein
MRLLIGIVLALFLPTLIAHAAAPEELSAIRTSVPHPAAKPAGGPLPRRVLFVQVAEGSTRADEPSATSFYVYDPANPKARLRKVFHGPGRDQHCQFVTPLFNGCGIAIGRMDAAKKPGWSRKLFWFDLLSGQIGNTIAEQTWCDEMIGADVWFLSSAWSGSGKGDDSSLIERTCVNRYNWRSDTLIQYDKGFSHLYRIGVLSHLAVEMPRQNAKADSTGEKPPPPASKDHQRILKVTLANETVEPLGELPEGGLPSFYLDEATGVYPAGADCRDGIYCIRNFSLFFKPANEDWHTVAKDVNIVKTFGGRMPRLPVAYVGKGRFAVAKTTKDHVEVPKEKEDNFDGTPGLSTTMLLDGRTGKILKETKPQLYDNNPPLRIPDDWWSPDAKPRKPEKQAARPSSFQQSNSGKTIRYADNKTITLAEDEEADESDDGRYLAVARAGSGKKPPSKIILVIDGKTGTVTECPITADGEEISVMSMAWQILCSEKPDKATIDAFRSPGSGYPWQPMPDW